jgi:hypothetical protein
LELYGYNFFNRQSKKIFFLVRHFVVAITRKTKTKKKTFSPWPDAEASQCGKQKEKKN